MDKPRPFFRHTIQSLAKDMDLVYTATPDQWLMSLSQNEKQRHIIGFTFPINHAVCHKILKDKAALSYLLTQAKVPCVPHTLFVRPDAIKYTGPMGVWQKITAHAKQEGFPLVVKSNEGSGGRNVFICHDQRDLEIAVHHIFESYRHCVISPYISSKKEYRLIVLGDKVLLAFAKEKGSDDKHNLSSGGQVSEITDDLLLKGLESLSQTACQVLGATLGVVDCFRDQETGLLMVLEINGAVSLENFAKQAVDGKQRAKNVYRHILAHCFEN